MNFRIIAACLSAAALCLILPAKITHAAITQPASTFSAGGGEGTSANYSNFGVIGQGQPVGVTTSSSYRNDAGFMPVLGGWKLLYPIIAVNPTTVSFSVVKDGSASQSAAMTNDGGSTLNWTTVSSAPSWLSVTPASGSGGATLNITATSANFTPGLYQGTITLDGTGAEGSAILVSMTVNDLYGLTVTITSDTDNVYGTVTGDGGIACQSGDLPTSSGCYKTFLPTTVVTLSQTPINSTFGGWPAECTPSGGNCQVTMNSSKNVGVAYTPNPATVRVLGDTRRYYAIEPALDASTANDVQARSLPLVDTEVIKSTTAAVRLKGGYNDGFLSQTGFTTIDGALKIRRGTLRVDHLKIK